jgi:DNA polymerase III delta subunit
MTIILHGENVIKSRDQLVASINQAKEDGKEIVRLNAKKISLADLETALQKTSLFGTEQLVIIEELHSLPRSKKKNLLIDTISQANVDVVLWEKRDLTKTMLKKFPKAQVEHFKLTNSLFNWLDAFSPKTSTEKHLKLMKEAQQTNGEHMCLVMLARQIRMLIQTKEGERPAGPPFVVNKLKKQAKDFSLKKLLDIHQRLFEIDLDVKTSGSYLSLGQELDLLAANL